MSQHIRRIASGLPVAPILWALRAHPELWNQHTARTADPASPHHGLDDIWARFTTDGPAEMAWLPAADVLGVRSMCLDVMRSVDGVELGGVLITRIPAGKECKPHTDPGWHARRYEKFGVQITSAPGQLFGFQDGSLETQPGDVFWFDNAHTHWVTNPTPYERITMIVCVRTEGD